MGRNPAPINQLAEPTKDGQPDENPQNNCTFASLAWIVRDIGSETDCDGDEIHDECEGQGATGPYDPSNAKFIAAAAKRGVALTIVRGTGAQLVAQLHAALAAGCDALINIPSQWGTPVSQQPPGFSTHCVAVAYSIAGPGLRCMNPWGGFWHDGDDAYWAARICYGYILIAAPAAVTVGGNPQPVSIILEKDSAGNVTGAHDASNPALRLGSGLAALAEQENLLNLDITLGESSVTVADGSDVQICVLSHTYLGTWHATRPCRLDTWFEAAQAIEALFGEAAQVPGLKQQLVAAQAAQAADDAQVQKLTGQVNAAATQLSAADTQIATLQQQLAAAQATPPAPQPTPQDTAIAQAAEAMVAAVEAALTAAKAGN